MYFCKNCGEPYMTDEAVMCVKCGVAKRDRGIITAITAVSL